MLGHRSVDCRKENNDKRKNEKVEKSAEDNDLVLCFLTSENKKENEEKGLACGEY